MSRNKWRRQYDDKYAIYGNESDGAINVQLMDRIDYVIDGDMLQDETFKYSNDELRDLSELYRMALNMDKKQLAVCVTAAIVKHPMMVFQLLAESFEERG